MAKFKNYLTRHMLITRVTFDCLEDDEYLDVPLYSRGDIPTKEKLLSIMDDIDTFLHLINDEEIKKYNDELEERLNDMRKKVSKRNNKKNNYTKGLVYLLKSKKDNIYKIGVTTNINKRLPQIATKLPFEIKLHHKIKCDKIYVLEKKLHNMFDDKRLNGEWFRLNKNDVKTIIEEGNNFE